MKIYLKKKSLFLFNVLIFYHAFVSVNFRKHSNLIHKQEFHAHFAGIIFAGTLLNANTEIVTLTSLSPPKPLF